MLHGKQSKAHLLAGASLAETDYRSFTTPSVGHNGVDCVCNAAVVRMSSSFPGRTENQDADTTRTSQRYRYLRDFARRNWELVVWTAPVSLEFLSVFCI